MAGSASGGCIVDSIGGRVGRRWWFNTLYSELIDSLCALSFGAIVRSKGHSECGADVYSNVDASTVESGV